MVASRRVLNGPLLAAALRVLVALLALLAAGLAVSIGAVAGALGWLDNARNTAHLRSADLLVAAGLLRTDRRFIGLLVRLVLFVGLLAGGEIDLCGHLSTNVGAADHRRRIVSMRR